MELSPNSEIHHNNHNNYRQWNYMNKLVEWKRFLYTFEGGETLGKKNEAILNCLETAGR